MDQHSTRTGITLNLESFWMRHVLSDIRDVVAYLGPEGLTLASLSSLTDQRPQRFATCSGRKTRLVSRRS